MLSIKSKIDYFETKIAISGDLYKILFLILQKWYYILQIYAKLLFGSLPIDKYFKRDIIMV